MQIFRDVHSMNIIHADIKPGNFLLVAGQLKLIDFGFAMEIIPGKKIISFSWRFLFFILLSCRTKRLCAEEEHFWNKGLYEPRSFVRLYY